MFFKKTAKPEDSSTFSEFIRNASAAEKKKVYTKVMKDAIEMQKQTMEAAKAKAKKTQSSH